jgi:hypothetical protein
VAGPGECRAQALADRQANTHLKVNAIMQIIEKTAFIENVLAASMSPGMAASLDWSRGVQSAPLPTNPFLRPEPAGAQHHGRDFHGWRRRLPGQCFPGGRRLDRQWRLQEPAPGRHGHGAGLSAITLAFNQDWRAWINWFLARR